MDIAEVLQKIRPGYSWKAMGDTYDDLIWLDDESKKPSRAEVEENWSTVEYDILAKTVRRERDSLLSNTDWIVTKSTELGKSVPVEWLEYRQALRDITSQNNFPHTIEWPTQPSSES